MAGEDAVQAHVPVSPASDARSLLEVVKSEKVALTVAITEIGVAASNVFSLAKVTPGTFVVASIALIAICALLNFTRAASQKWIGIITALGIGCLVIAFARYQRVGPELSFPLLRVEAFEDKDGDGLRGPWEGFVSQEDSIAVRFVPQSSKPETRILDLKETFNNFKAGETVTVTICGIDRDVKTLDAKDPNYKLASELTIPIPKAIFDRCGLKGRQEAS
ncbi:hypothetical protein E5A73_09240 [Sphingomonas gei]|uniref:Uncharacterized protein n=1 Tax=Sphingomonas gei TaxID=1395960 RepID=A0A4S1XFA3_9SPHN|nr:hypothetical protein [Sphingomonas gei]TGX54280.1 hypothetical protein E5A73_09240 [Sphingomonas gei]